MPSKKSGFTARWNDAVRGFATPRGRITLVAMVCVVAAAILMAARPPSPSVEVTAVDFRPQVDEVAAQEPAAPAASRQPGATKVRARTAASTTSRPDAPAKASAANVVPSRPSDGVMASNATPSLSRADVVESGPKGPEASSAPAQAASAVSITGCLERDDDRFQLKDTEGENAPKSRSWKSGFLRRSTPSIDVADPANRLRLANHVGHRVTLSGMLVEREMQARTLLMVAKDCDS